MLVEIHLAKKGGFIPTYLARVGFRRSFYHRDRWGYSLGSLLGRHSPKNNENLDRKADDHNPPRSPIFAARLVSLLGAKQCCPKPMLSIPAPRPKPARHPCGFPGHSVAGQARPTSGPFHYRTCANSAKPELKHQEAYLSPAKASEKWRNSGRAMILRSRQQSLRPQAAPRARRASARPEWRP